MKNSEYRNTSGNKHNAICICKDTEYYVLITDYISEESPLTCGRCNLKVPLHQLPNYTDKDCTSIKRWVQNYKACDTLQMNSDVGEEWALNQMQNIDSSLSKQGLNICRVVEQKTKIPTYYYLHNYNHIKTNTAKCSTCNNPWRLEHSIHNFYAYKCNVCKVISTEPQEV